MRPLTTIHHQPKYIHHQPPPTTTTHQQPKYIHHHSPPPTIHPPLPTTTQKMDYHPAKAKIYSYIAPFDIVLTVSFSSKSKPPWWRFCVIKFWSARFSNSKNVTLFKIFWSLYFKSLRLLNTSRVSNQKDQLLSLVSFKW